jgi:hypothetical protein
MDKDVLKRMKEVEKAVLGLDDSVRGRLSPSCAITSWAEATRRKSVTLR